MKDAQFKWVLMVSGFITLLAGLQYFAPGTALGLSQLSVGDPAGLLFARHWGLMAGCFGALLLYAAYQPAVRAPVVLAAAVEKTGLVLAIFMQWDEPALAGLHVPAIFDTVCVLLYAVWLVRRQNLK